MSPGIKIDTIIVSDVHLGSLISRADKLSELLSKYDFKRLIILGDLFDNSNFKRLNKENWELLSLIRKLSDPKDGREVVWILGNHDKKVADTMPYLVGTKACEQYIWEHNSRKFLAVHGDRFDQTIADRKFFGIVVHHIFLFFQNFDRKAKHIVKFLDKSNSSFRKLSEKVANGAAQYAEELDADYVFCGHTHVPMQKVFNISKSPIHYYNVGCWTRLPSTFAAVDDSGNIFLENFE